MEEKNMEQLNEIEQDETSKTKALIFDIEVKMQEIDAIIERQEDEFFTKDQEVSDETHNKIIQLKNEYKNLYKQKKQLQKTLRVSLWDNFPVWMAFYALIQFVFSFYLIMTQLSTYFAQWFFQMIQGGTSFVFYLSLFIVPALNLLVPFIVLLLLKNKTHKKFFMYIYFIHGIETLMSIGMLLYAVLK